jgi:peptidyl-prolyl cis-trans isomerase C
LQGQLKDEVIAREIFMQEAQKRGLEATADYKNQMELARQTLLIRELFADFQKKDPVTDADIKAEYDKPGRCGQRRARNTAHATSWSKRKTKPRPSSPSLKKGGKFDEIAKKQSKDPGSGAHGGDLGWANAASYVPEFSDAMIKLNKGQTTEVPVNQPVRLSRDPRG